MQKPKKHILVCGSFRSSGEPQGVCDKKNSKQLLPYLESELADREMNQVMVSSTSCLKACDRGPVLVIYPDNFWYGNVDSHAVVDEILDALEAGKAVERLLLK
jgi:(2Fe-2S) ferredoxin